MLRKSNEIRPDFVVYRPAVQTGRLDSKYNPSSTAWKPSLSYKYTLSDVRNQFTPAENYRNRLVTSGPLIRQLQRLEWRWEKNLPEFIKAATRVQSLFRGIKNRQKFNLIKDTLKLHFAQREGKRKALHLYNDERFLDSIAVINQVPVTNDELQDLKMRAEYKLKQFNDCISTAKGLIGEGLRCILTTVELTILIKYRQSLKKEMKMLIIS